MDPLSFLAALLAVHLGAVATPGPNTLLVTNIAASRAPVQRLYRRVQPVIAGGTGLLMVGFGLVLIFAL